MLNWPDFLAPTRRVIRTTLSSAQQPPGGFRRRWRLSALPAAIAGGGGSPFDGSSRLRTDDDHVHLLVTPEDENGISRFMQALGDAM